VLPPGFRTPIVFKPRDKGVDVVRVFALTKVVGATSPFKRISDWLVGPLETKLKPPTVRVEGWVIVEPLIGTVTTGARMENDIGEELAPVGCTAVSSTVCGVCKAVPLSVICNWLLLIKAGVRT